MQTINSFQFNACPKVPSRLHRTEMEIIEFCNSRFRDYYDQLAEAVLAHVERTGLTKIVELGAGCGPLTDRLASDPRAAGLRFVVCDLIPDRAAFQSLEERYPGRVAAEYEPVDFGRHHEWGADSLLVLCAAFHHIPLEQRTSVLKALCESGGGVMIFAPIRKTLWCMFTSSFVLVPSVLLPIGFWNRPGRWRRVLWCWLLPLAPLMMVWDGIGGCLRHWDRGDWSRAAKSMKLPRELVVEETSNSQTVVA